MASTCFESEPKASLRVPSPDAAMSENGETAPVARLIMRA
jgi:hypothetical protein